MSADRLAPRRVSGRVLRGAVRLRRHCLQRFRRDVLAGVGAARIPERARRMICGALLLHLRPEAPPPGGEAPSLTNQPRCRDL